MIHQNAIETLQAREQTETSVDIRSNCSSNCKDMAFLPQFFWGTTTLRKMSWADFRGKLLGPTDPAAAPAGSLREQIYSKWEDLGRLASQHSTLDKV